MVGSLFDRLTLGAAAETINEDESIRRHIMRMLTTRQGAVQTVPDYGLPDLNDLNYSKSDLIAECCRAITRSIDQYEPRLTGVKVEPAEADQGAFTLVFLIKATKIDEHGETSPWSLSVTLDGNNFKQ